MRKCITRKSLTKTCLCAAPPLIPPVPPISCDSPLQVPEDVSASHPKTDTIAKRTQHRAPRKQCGCVSSNKSKQTVSKAVQPCADEEKFFLSRNSYILGYKVGEKIQRWQERLCCMSLLYWSYHFDHWANPEDKKIAVMFKKVKRSYEDSKKAFMNFLEDLHYPEVYVPDTPLCPPGSMLQDSSYLHQKFDSIREKAQSRNLHRYVEKKTSMNRKKARKNKQAEREFWLRQWEEDSDMKPYVDDFDVCDGGETFEGCDYDYQELLDVEAALVEAEKALESPCVEAAAWAIHEGKANENLEIIEEAEMIFYNYQMALELYEYTMGLVSGSLSDDE